MRTSWPTRSLDEARADPARLSIGDPATCRADPAARTPSFFARRPLCRVDDAVLEALRRAAEVGGPARISLHGDPQGSLHEMLILQRRDRGFPPKRHPQKAKSFTILDGSLLVVVFTGAGEIHDACILGKGAAHVYRVAAGYHHVDLPLTETAIHLECTLGPFLGAEDRELAPWGPPLGDEIAGRKFRAELLAILGLAEQ